MEGLAIGFLVKLALVSQSKLARPLLVTAPILIILALPQVETLVATLIVWLAPTRGILEKPAFAFLLVNCVIVTIIASSKLGSEKRGHEKESEGEIMGQINGRGAEKGDLVPDIVVGAKSHYLDTSLESGYDYPYGEHSLRRSLSLNARYKNKTKHEEAKLKHVIERKSNRKVRQLASMRNDKVGLSHPNERLRNDLKRKHMNRGSLSILCEAGSPQYEKPTPQNCFDATTADCLSRPPECPRDAAATVTDHPSLEEVWAAIMASNKTDHRMACKPQAELIPSIGEADSKNFKRLQPAPATDAPTPPPAAVALDPPPAVLLHSSQLPAALAATAAHPARRAAKAAPIPRAGMPSKPHIAAEKKHVEDGKDNQENDRELEELNRRAEEFIARFNRQIRLQREESLQSQKRRPRPCNYDVQDPEHAFALRVPARGLLVG